MQIARYILIFVALIAVSCGEKNSITPLSQPKKLVLNNVNLNIQGDIEPVKIQRSFIRRFTGSLIGWIPLFGEILEMPLDLSLSLAKALIPPIPVTNDIPIKPGASWTDEEVLSIVTSVKLMSGYLQVVARENGGYNPFATTPANDLSFIKDVHVSLIFRNQNQEVVEEVPLADAIIEKDFVKETQMLKFTTTKTNIKPYYEKYKKLEIRTLASGKFPSQDITIVGKFNIAVNIKMPQPY